MVLVRKQTALWGCNYSQGCEWTQVFLQEVVGLQRRWRKCSQVAAFGEKEQTAKLGQVEGSLQECLNHQSS